MILRKGYDILVKAFFNSGLYKIGCKVLIVGEGTEMSRLREQTAQLGISDSVRFVGRKTKSEIIELMHESHAFVLSSRAETFGGVCIEALSQGLPNIATICGGPEEFINENNGVLIPIDDVDAMSEAMIDMYTNYSKYEKNSIVEECKRKFAPQVIAQQLTGIFESVIKQ